MPHSVVLNTQPKQAAWWYFVAMRVLMREGELLMRVAVQGLWDVPDVIVEHA